MLKKKKEVHNLSNDCRSADIHQHISNRNPERRSKMNTQDESTKNKTVVSLRSIGGKHTSNKKNTKAPIKSKELDRVWLEHFARAIYKNGLLDDKQYKKHLSVLNAECQLKCVNRG